MTSPLLDFIKKQIALNGPMDTGTYMGHVLGHPQYGYYIRRDPFGMAGDFITAPEISQMFGETIGAWAVHAWMNLGSPERFVLLEAGPGRGTLMADLLRVTKEIPGFHAALDLHFLETSPVLRAAQKDAVKPFKAHWHDALGSVPMDKPVIVIANEFLDALPARQFEMTDSGWAERVVTLADGDALTYGLRPAAEAVHFIPAEFSKAPRGSIYGFSPACVSLAANISSLLKKNGGAALLIDYGHKQHALGDTFKAIYHHTVVHPLTHVGSADLSFHVDFATIAEAASAVGVDVHGPVSQGAFLQSIGIESRARVLQANASEAQKDQIEKALRRLVDSDQMGVLFKVLGLSYATEGAIAGF